MTSPFAEFTTLAVLHALAVISPGPDFAIVLRQSVVHGRRVALATSAGIGSGIVVHVLYSVLGLGLLLRTSPRVLEVIQIVGAAYLLWLGIQSLRARPRSDVAAEASPQVDASGVGVRRAFITGFLTNATNVKATWFFLSVFTVVVSPQTPRWLQGAYGAWMAVTTTLWFSLVSFGFSQPAVRRAFLRRGHWFDRAMGVVLIALAVRLALSRG
jgi:RhtB (resistance to homoserine/threonine) family protein